MERYVGGTGACPNGIPFQGKCISVGGIQEEVADGALHSWSRLWEYPRDILKLPNVHYIYHLRFGSLRRRLAQLLTSINFTVTAPIDTGSGTAFVGSLGLGLIPVGYVDIDASAEEGCLSGSWRIDAIDAAINKASRMSLSWYQNASALAVKRYRRNHDPAIFAEKFGKFHDEVVSGQ